MKRWLLFIICMVAAAQAVEPVTVHHGRLPDYIGGEGEGVALQADGRLTLAARLVPVIDLAAERIWSMTSDGKRLVVGTGDEGTVHVVEGDRSVDHFDVPQGAPIALGVGSSGLYIGAGPRGRLLRRGPDGSTEALVVTQSQYIWDVAIDENGVLLGCGADAQVLRWSRDGTVDTLLNATNDGHVRVLARRGQQWLAGTAVSEGSQDSEGRGRVYELGQNGGRLLLETTYEEVSAMASMGDAVFIAAMTVPSTGTPTVALLRLNADGASYPVWHGTGIWAGLVRDGDDLLAVTREPTRVLRWAADGQTGAVLARSDSVVPGTIAFTDGTLILADAHSGRLWKLDRRRADEGHFDSAVHDAGSVATWGRLSWKGEGNVEILTRSGNSVEPDETWSVWSAVQKDETIRSPSARYLQYRIRLEAGGDSTPSVDRIVFSLRQANLPPRIEDVVTFPYRGGPGALQNPDQIPLPGQHRNNGNGLPQRKSLRVLRWKADDPNGDPLLIDIYLRGDGQSHWKLLEEGVERVKTVVWDTEVMPEGITQLRLVARDTESNPGDTALEDSYITAPFTIDNTPPVVQLRLRQQGDDTMIEAQIIDGISALRGARFSLDYDDETTRLAAADGLFDTPQEQLRFTLPPLPPGEHVVSVQAWDELENVGVGQILVEIP